MRTIYAYFHGENVRLKVSSSAHIRQQYWVFILWECTYQTTEVYKLCQQTFYQFLILYFHNLLEQKTKNDNPESAAVLTVGFLENYLRKNVFKDMLHCNLNTNCFFFFFDQDACIVTLHNPLSYTFCVSCS